MKRIIHFVIMAVATLMTFQCLAKAAGNSTTKHALMILTSHDKLGNTGKPTGFYLSEMTHPYFALAEKGIKIDFASPAGGKAPIAPKSINLSDQDNKRFLDDATLKSQIENTAPISKVDINNYDAIILVGGMGPMWDFTDNKPLQDEAMSLYARGGVVAAVCHGPAGLLNMKLANGKYFLAGKTVTGFSNDEEDELGYTKVVPFSLEDKLKEHGATYEKAPPQGEEVVVSDRLVTGQNPASARKFGEEIAKLINVGKSP